MPNHRFPDLSIIEQLMASKARPLSVVKLVKLDFPPFPIIKGLPLESKIGSPLSFCKTGSVLTSPVPALITLAAGI